MAKRNVLETVTKKITVTKEAWAQVEGLQREMGVNIPAQIIERAIREFYQKHLGEKEK